MYKALHVFRLTILTSIITISCNDDSPAEDPADSGPGSDTGQPSVSASETETTSGTQNDSDKGSGSDTHPEEETDSETGTPTLNRPDTESPPTDTDSDSGEAESDSDLPSETDSESETDTGCPHPYYLDESSYYQGDGQCPFGNMHNHQACEMTAQCQICFTGDPSSNCAVQYFQCINGTWDYVWHMDPGEGCYGDAGDASTDYTGYDAGYDAGDDAGSDAGNDGGA